MQRCAARIDLTAGSARASEIVLCVAAPRGIRFVAASLQGAPVGVWPGGVIGPLGGPDGWMSAPEPSVNSVPAVS